MDVTIYTAEGDKVTLSRESQWQAKYNTYEYLARGDRGVVQEQNATLLVQSSESTQYAVEGDLNDQEAADVQAALSIVENMMADFLAGRTEDAMAHNGDFGVLASIAGVDTELEHDLSIEAHDESSILAPASESPLEAAAVRGPGLLDQLLDGLVSAVKESQADSTKLMPHLRNLFARLQNLCRGAPAADQKASVIDTVADQLTARLAESDPAAAAWTPGLLLQA